MAIRPFVTAWAHVRVMLKRRILARVLLEEIGYIERTLPMGNPGTLDRRTLEVPRPRYVTQYPAHYVTYFDADVARLVREYLNALDDYVAALANERAAVGDGANHDEAPRADPASEVAVWRHVRELKHAGGALDTTLRQLAGKGGGTRKRSRAAASEL